MAHDEDFEAIGIDASQNALIDDTNFINDYYNLNTNETQYQNNYPP